MLLMTLNILNTLLWINFINSINDHLRIIFDVYNFALNSSEFLLDLLEIPR